MAFIIAEDMDYVGVKCADCGKVIVSSFCGYGIPQTVVSDEDFYKIQKHKCGKRRKNKK